MATSDVTGVHKDALNPDAEFESQLKLLVQDAQAAGVSHAEIAAMLRSEAKAVENDEPISELFD